MAGHMGATQVTSQTSRGRNHDDNGLILVGAVPGSKGGWVQLRMRLRRLY